MKITENFTVYAVWDIMEDHKNLIFGFFERSDAEKLIKLLENCYSPEIVNHPHKEYKIINMNLTAYTNLMSSY